MKKMIIAIASIGVACVVQAASYSWTLSSASDYVGKDAYAFDSADRTAVIALLTAGGESVASDLAAYVKGGPTQAEGRAGKENFKGSASVADGASKYEAFFILFDSAIADGNTYSISDNLDVTASVSQSGSGGKEAFTQTAAATFTTTDQKIGNVPEPTSAMLLLLGIAGLALRRKQK